MDVSHLLGADIKVIFDSNFFDRLYQLVISSINKQRNEYKQNNTTLTEFEFRFGRIKSLDRDNRKWLFDSTIEPLLFTTLIQKLQSITNNDNNWTYAWKYDIVISRQSSTGENIRKIIRPKILPTNYIKTGSPIPSINIQNIDMSSVTIIYQSKSPTESVDQPFTTINPDNIDARINNVYIIKFASSQELINSQYEKLFNAADSSKENIRIRRRLTFEHKKLPFVFDLTIINDREHSIECEYKLYPQAVSENMMNKINDRRFILSTVCLPPFKLIINLLWPTINQVSGAADITNKYFNLIDISTGGHRLIEAQPKNIKQKEISQLTSGYSWTNKLNGQKYRLMICELSLFNKSMLAALLISNTNTKIIAIDYSTNKEILGALNNSLFDIEYFIPTDHTPIINVFDCLVFVNKSVTTTSHDHRLFPIYAFESKLNTFFLKSHCGLEIKRFFYSNNPLQDLDNVLKYMLGRYKERMEEDNDGLIMTPVGDYTFDINGKSITRNKSYYDRTFPVFKWKWPKDVTIDFLLQEIDTFERDKITYKVFQLFSWAKDNPILFKPHGYGLLPIPILNVPNTHPEYKHLKSGQIGEVNFNKLGNQFELVKIRYDKTIPNQENVAYDTFTDMINEFDLYTLRKLLSNVQESHCLTNYRLFHNRIKAGLINQWMKDKIVLDLGAGKGGDLFKYAASNVKYLWAVEPNSQYITEPEGLEYRLRKLPELMNRTTIIQTGAEDYEAIHGQVNIADVISTFFSLTFLFQNQIYVDNLIKTISSCLNIGGKFIGTVMDGERIWKSLQINEELKGMNKDKLCWWIRRNYAKDMPLSIGNAISLNLSGTPTIPDIQHEWLVPFDILRKSLEKVGFILLETNTFDDPIIRQKFIRQRSQDQTMDELYNAMNLEEKELNSLYRYFVFEKKNNILYSEESVQIIQQEIQESEYIPELKQEVVEEVKQEPGEEVKQEPVGAKQPAGIIQEPVEEVTQELVEAKQPVEIIQEPVKEVKQEPVEETQKPSLRHKIEQMKPKHKRLLKLKQPIKIKLGILPEDETEEINPLKAEIYNKPLYRVGVIGDGSCLFYSLMFLLINQTYRNLSHSERIKLIKQMRNTISDALSLTLFRELANEQVELLSWIKSLHSMLKNAMITEVERENMTPVITDKELTEIIEHISSYPTINEQISLLTNKLLSLGFSNEEISIAIEQARLRAFYEYKAKLKDCKEYANWQNIELIMRLIGRNIFIISGESQLPFKVINCNLYNPEYASLVILNLDAHEHFEPLVELIQQPNGDITPITNFPWDHPLIKGIYNYMCN